MVYTNLCTFICSISCLSLVQSDMIKFTDAAVIKKKTPILGSFMVVSEPRRRGRPRDEAHLARRELEILEAATSFFAEHGFANADMQELADELGIGKGTIYRYFPSKEALFFATVDNGMTLLHEHVFVKTGFISDPLEKLNAAAKAFLGFFDKMPELAELLIQERSEFKHRFKPTYLKHREAHIGPWNEMIRGLIKQGRIREMPVSQITTTLSNLLYGAVFTHHFSPDDETLEQRADDIIDICMGGVLSDSEREHRRQSKNNLGQATTETKSTSQKESSRQP